MTCTLSSQTFEFSKHYYFSTKWTVTGTCEHVSKERSVLHKRHFSRWKHTEGCWVSLQKKWSVRISRRTGPGSGRRSVTLTAHSLLKLHTLYLRRLFSVLKQSLITPNISVSSLTVYRLYSIFSFHSFWRHLCSTAFLGRTSAQYCIDTVVFPVLTLEWCEEWTVCCFILRFHTLSQWLDSVCVQPTVRLLHAAGLLLLLY